MIADLLRIEFRTHDVIAKTVADRLIEINGIRSVCRGCKRP